jgi:hypothetical protein
MTPEEIAQKRFATLAIMRASGVVVMLIGLWFWHGNIIRAGGAPMIGAPVFLVGVLDAILIPALLRRQWRGR